MSVGYENYLNEKHKNDGGKPSHKYSTEQLQSMIDNVRKRAANGSENQ